jgi:cell division protease FtsH
MITEYGMGRTLGPATYPRQQRPLFLGVGEGGPAPREYSERTAAQVDDEVKALLEEREARVRRLVEERREALEKVARRLLEVEVLYTEEFERLAGCGAVPGPVGEAA